jgi:hypothetical protein
MADDKSNRIGYRYLFDSKGCSLSGLEEVKINLIVSEKYDVQLYFGPKPQYKIDSVVGCSKYYVPGTKAPLGKCQINGDASQSSEHGPFFFEIVVSTEADAVDADNIITHDLLMKQAEARRDEFKNIINLAAGITGLRFHRQFVLELLNENALAWEGQVSVKRFAGPALELLENISLNDNDIKHIKAIGEKLKTLTHEDVQECSLVFHWLLRAWHQRDILYQFIDLFIPLECILGKSEISDEDKHYAEHIQRLIQNHADEHSEDLRSFFDRLIRRSGPTLHERFIDLAKTAQLPGWEADIEAFRKFNRMRNVLLHGADNTVQQTLSVGEKEVRTLSDLVERYVNYFFFKDNKVYQSRWRPKIGEKSKNSVNPV